MFKYIINTPSIILFSNTIVNQLNMYKKQDLNILCLIIIMI